MATPPGAPLTQSSDRARRIRTARLPHARVRAGETWIRGPMPTNGWRRQMPRAGGTVVRTIGAQSRGLHALRRWAGDARTAVRRGRVPCGRGRDANAERRRGMSPEVGWGRSRSRADGPDADACKQRGRSPLGSETGAVVRRGAPAPETGRGHGRRREPDVLSALFPRRRCRHRRPCFGDRSSSPSARPRPARSAAAAAIADGSATRDAARAASDSERGISPPTRFSRPRAVDAAARGIGQSGVRVACGRRRPRRAAGRAQRAAAARALDARRGRS